LKIYIKLNTGKRYNIPAPIGLVKAFLSLGNVGLSIAKKHVPAEQRIYFEDIDMKELKKGLDILKAYKGLEMIDINAADGTKVKIVI